MDGLGVWPGIDSLRRCCRNLLPYDVVHAPSIYSFKSRIKHYLDIQ